MKNLIESFNNRLNKEKNQELVNSKADHFEII